MGELASYAYHNCEFARALAAADLASPSEAVMAVRIKANCEMDRGAEALLAADEAVALFPDSGLLHYLRGQAAYLAGRSRAEIEAAFLSAAERRFPGAAMGLAFLEFANKRFASAITLLGEAAGVEGELEHVRRLMLFQVYAADQRFAEAEKELQHADRLLAQAPSLLRHYWGQLCWVRHLRLKGNFAGAAAVLERIEAQLDPVAMPRLGRNVGEARRMIDAKSEEPNIVVPPQRAAASALAADPRLKALETITRKPMLHSLFTYLGARGPAGATKEEIAANVWEENYNPLIHDDRIYKAVGRIRRLLGDDIAAPQLLTQMGRHYVLNLPAKPAAAGDPHEPHAPGKSVFSPSSAALRRRLGA